MMDKQITRHPHDMIWEFNAIGSDSVPTASMIRQHVGLLSFTFKSIINLQNNHNYVGHAGILRSKTVKAYH